jgi:hypothetical protein
MGKFFNRWGRGLQIAFYPAKVSVMHFRQLFIPLLALVFLGAARAPSLSIRFHAAATKEDGPAFATLVEYGNPPRQAYIKKVPEISERDIVAIWPVPAADGSMGCLLKLNEDGRIRLLSLSSTIKGKVLVCLVNKRLVTALLVDKQVDDGQIFISSGLTPAEIEAFRKVFPVLGETKKK